MSDFREVVREAGVKTPTQELYASLELAYDTFNEDLFGGMLPKVIFTAREAKGALGYYHRDAWVNNDGLTASEIAINFKMVANASILSLMSTIVHEMGHYFQELKGTPSKRSYHNREFAMILERVGLITSTTGRPGGDRVGERMSDYPLAGGPFVFSCAKLIMKEKFRLAWVDSYQMERRAPQDGQDDIISLLTTDGFDGELLKQDHYKCDESVLPRPREDLYFLDDDDGNSDKALRSESGEKVSFVKAIQEDAELASVVSCLAETPNIGKSWEGGLPSDEEYENTIKRKVKIAYQCAKCGSKVWGKPGLVVKCFTFDCGDAMKELI